MANFHYITRMSSGFKVYILEGKRDFCFVLMYHVALERMKTCNTLNSGGNSVMVMLSTFSLVYIYIYIILHHDNLI